MNHFLMATRGKTSTSASTLSSEGPFVSRFQQEFSARVGHKFGVAVSNGSAMPDAAVTALGAGGGDKVILPAFTIILGTPGIVGVGAITQMWRWFP